RSGHISACFFAPQITWARSVSGNSRTAHRVENRPEQRIRLFTGSQHWSSDHGICGPVYAPPVPGTEPARVEGRADALLSRTLQSVSFLWIVAPDSFRLGQCPGGLWPAGSSFRCWSQRFRVRTPLRE